MKQGSQWGPAESGTTEQDLVAQVTWHTECVHPSPIPFIFWTQYLLMRSCTWHTNERIFCQAQTPKNAIKWTLQCRTVSLHTNSLFYKRSTTPSFLLHFFSPLINSLFNCLNQPYIFLQCLVIALIVERSGFNSKPKWHWDTFSSQVLQFSPTCIILSMLCANSFNHHWCCIPLEIDTVTKQHILTNPFKHRNCSLYSFLIQMQWYWFFGCPWYTDHLLLKLTHHSWLMSKAHNFSPCPWYTDHLLLKLTHHSWLMSKAHNFSPCPWSPAP
jgi:hypothetical protein